MGKAAKQDPSHPTLVVVCSNCKKGDKLNAEDECETVYAPFSYKSARDDLVLWCERCKISLRLPRIVDIVFKEGYRAGIDAAKARIGNYVRQLKG